MFHGLKQILPRVGLDTWFSGQSFSIFLQKPEDTTLDIAQGRLCLVRCFRGHRPPLVCVHSMLLFFYACVWMCKRETESEGVWNYKCSSGCHGDLVGCSNDVWCPADNQSFPSRVQCNWSQQGRKWIQLNFIIRIHNFWEESCQRLLCES